MSPSSTFSAGISRHRSQTMAPGILEPCGDEAPAMAARAAYNGINWPVFEKAAKKMRQHHSFFTDRPGGRAPSRYPMRNARLTFYNGHFSILKKNPDSLPTCTNWDFESYIHIAESNIKICEACADSCEASFYALRAFLWSFDRPQTPTGSGGQFAPPRLGPTHP